MVRFVPKPYRNSLFIAGGFAVHPASATDIDVWIINNADPSDPDRIETTDIRRDVLVYLTDRGFNHRELPESRVTNVIDGYPADTIKIATVRDTERAKEIHLLTTDLSPMELLDTFDLSISQIGFDLNGRVYTTEAWTDLQTPIRVLRETPTTQDRLEKYMLRFNLTTEN
jgi:hypothetical protein